MVEIASSDDRKNRWVELLKNKGMYIETQPDGNCAIYSLAVYFSAVFPYDEKYTKWLSNTYTIGSEDKWCSPHSKDKSNELPLFDKHQVNRHKMVKIFHRAIEETIERAQECDRNGDYFPNALRSVHWDNITLSKELKKYFALYEMFEKSSFSGIVNTEHIFLIPDDMKNKNVRNQKYDFMNKMVDRVLSTYCADAYWMSSFFIKTVINQVAHDYSMSDMCSEQDCLFPWIFCEKKSEEEYDPFDVIFSDLCHIDERAGVMNKLSDTEDIKLYSPIMIVHLPGHYGVVVIDSMLPDEFHPEEFWYLRKKTKLRSKFREFLLSQPNEEKDAITVDSSSDEEIKPKKRIKRGTRGNQSICEPGGEHEITRAILQRLSF